LNTATPNKQHPVDEVAGFPTSSRSPPWRLLRRPYSSGRIGATAWYEECRDSGAHDLRGWSWRHLTSLPPH